MKKAGIIFLLLSMLAFVGCAELKSSITEKVTSITSNVDPNLVAKVPDDKRGGFPKAEFAVKLGEEKLKLAELKSDLAAKEKKYIGYEEELVSIDLKEAVLDYDIIKLEAVDAAGLMKKEDSIKTLTNLKLKKVDLQGDRIKADANMASVKRQIQDIKENIKGQEDKVKNLKMEKVKPAEKAPVSAEKEKADKGTGTEEKPKEKAPAAPVEKTK